jgi:hypothetical protein
MRKKGLDARKVWGLLSAGMTEWRRQVVKLVPVEAFATMELDEGQ